MCTDSRHSDVFAWSVINVVSVKSINVIDLVKQVGFVFFLILPPKRWVQLIVQSKFVYHGQDSR